MECYHEGLSGELAQLVERCDRTAEVRDSSSLFSIKFTEGDCGFAPFTPKDKGLADPLSKADKMIVAQRG